MEMAEATADRNETEKKETGTGDFCFRPFLITATNKSQRSGALSKHRSTAGQGSRWHRVVKAGGSRTHQAAERAAAARAVRTRSRGRVEQLAGSWLPAVFCCPRVLDTVRCLPHVCRDRDIFVATTPTPMLPTRPRQDYRFFLALCCHTPQDCQRSRQR